MSHSPAFAPGRRPQRRAHLLVATGSVHRSARGCGFGICGTTKISPMIEEYLPAFSKADI